MNTNTTKKAVDTKGATTPYTYITLNSTAVNPLSKAVFKAFTPAVTVDPLTGEEIKSDRPDALYTKYLECIAVMSDAVKNPTKAQKKHAADTFAIICECLQIPEIIKLENDSKEYHPREFTSADYDSLRTALLNVFNNTDKKINDEKATKTVYTDFGVKAGTTTKNLFEKWLFVRDKNMGNYAAAIGATDARNDKNRLYTAYNKAKKDYARAFRNGKTEAYEHHKETIYKNGHELGYTDEEINTHIAAALTVYDEKRKEKNRPDAPHQPESTVTVPEGLTSANDRAATEPTDKKDETAAA